MSLIDLLTNYPKQWANLFVNSIKAATVEADTLVLDGVTFTGEFAPPIATRNLTSSFFGGSVPVTFKVIGTRSQFNVTTREFNIPGVSRTGNQDYFYVEVPHLLDYNLSGIIPYSYDQNLPAFELAVCWKLSGISEMYVCPIGATGFDPAINPGATLYFSPGHLTATDYNA
jgi:hypothetical protein